ncbi:MAG: nitronate monooxygenase [Dehalococcoidia bacterium]
MLHTRFTELLGIQYPIMSAPMALHSSGPLAAAVSKAGGLGSFGGINPGGGNWVREQIRHVRAETDRPFGVGFITHYIPMLPQCFEAAVDEHAPVIAFSFVDPKPWITQAKESGATTICQVQSMAGAREAVDAGADVLVAQGNEAGGHTGTMNLLPFLARVIDAFPDVPVLASGGISSGRALAAVLAAGAEGAWLGTALLATTEATDVSDAHKQRIVASDGEDTIYTQVFDIVDGSSWPNGIAGRVHNNTFAQEWQGRERELRAKREELAPAYTAAYERRDPDTMALYFGTGAGSVSAIRPAADVITSICTEAEQLLRERSERLLR